MHSDYEAHELAAVFPLLPEAELSGLADDIGANGLNQPIVLYQGKILDGRNRYEACRRSGVTPRFTQWAGGWAAAKRFVWGENFHRRHLSSDQRAACWVLYERTPDSDEAEVAQRAREEAARRKVAGLKRGAEKPAPVAQTIESRGRNERATDAKIAREAGTNRTYLAKARQLDDSTLHEIREGKARLPDIMRRERVERRAAACAEIAKANTSLPAESRRYGLIYCDPPWRYEHVKTESRAIENQYPTMDLAEICALPVQRMALDDCALFMWATSPKLAEALQVLTAWGFTYRTCAVWDKQKIGMGYYFRQQHELILVATRGAPPAPDAKARVSSVLSFPRGKHSAKPHEVYGLLEAMYPAEPKVELFARNGRDGWDAWGNQSA